MRRWTDGAVSVFTFSPSLPPSNRNSEHLRHALLQNPDTVYQSVLLCDLPQPARRLVDMFEGEFERAVVHRHQPVRAQIAKNFHRLVRSHVYPAKGIRKVGADGQQGDLWFEPRAHFLESVKIGAVAGVINAAAFMFQNETAVAAMIVPQQARAPVFAGGQRHFPVASGKALPPFEFDHALKTQAVGKVAHAPGHYGDFRMRQTPQRWLVEMIEM